MQTLQLAHFVVKEPIVIGHDCAGIIKEVGSEVKSLVPGDRVALELGISCWRYDLYTNFWWGGDPIIILSVEVAMVAIFTFWNWKWRPIGSSIKNKKLTWKGYYNFEDEP